jgi:RNA polymerase sigma-70 factor (ECF subfamily)
MAARPKSPEEVGELFQLHRRSLFNMIARLIGSYDEAHDVLQETFLRAVQGWGGFRGQAEARTWLYRIAVNCSYTHMKRRRRSSQFIAELTPRPLEASASEHGVLDEARRHMVERALTSLGPDLRSVLLLRDLEELSYSEIAGVLGWSEGTVASRLNRARRLLGKKLKELGVV